MLVEKLERWSYLLLVLFLFLSAFIPVYCLLFVQVAMLIWLYRLLLLREQPETKLAVQGIGTWLLILFLLLPLSVNVFVGMRQYLLLLISCMAFALPGLLVSSEQLIFRILLGISRCLVVLAVFLLAPSEFLPNSVLNFTEQILQNSGHIYMLAANVTHLFPFVLLAGVVSSKQSNLQRLQFGLASVATGIILWKIGSWAHFLVLAVILSVVVLVAWQQLTRTSLYQFVLAWLLTIISLISLFRLEGFGQAFWQWLYQIYSYQSLWTIFAQHPFVGFGLDSLSSFFYDYTNSGQISGGLSNMYTGVINMSIETGLLGLFATCCMLFLLGKSSWQRWRTTRQIAALASLLLTVGFSVEFIFFHYLILPGVMIVFFLLQGMSQVNESAQPEVNPC